MNKKIKVIELLNKIANGEDLPKRIKIQDYVFELSKDYEHYYYNEDVEITHLINHIYHYEIKNDKGLDLDVVELKYYKKLVKIINLMAERLAEDKEWFYSEFDNYTKQDFIEYFTNKAEESEK